MGAEGGQGYGEGGAGRRGVGASVHAMDVGDSRDHRFAGFSRLMSQEIFWA